VNLEVVRKKLWKPRDDIHAPSRGILCEWVRPEDDEGAPFVDMHRYGELLKVLPDKIVDSLERARLERAGIGAMLKAGLGYEELLSSIIVDGTAIASSSAEARLVPAMLIPANYLAPGGIPGRTLRVSARGRETTLTTAATMTFRFRIAATDIITGTIVAASGAIAQDAAAQTNTMWEVNCDFVTRAVGAAGTVFGIGRAEMSGAALTVAARTAGFMGSAGSATPATVTWDTTIAQYLEFTGQWSLATAYSIQAHTYCLEALN
jgi:hypothetical protein